MIARINESVPSPSRGGFTPPISSTSKSGQALIEVMIGMVVILVLVSSILQIASMCRAHTDVMVEARAEAAERCMFELGPGMETLSDADYIGDWNEGNDQRRLSRDDEHDTGDTAAFQEKVVDKSATDWSIIDSVPNNRISRLRADPMVISSFGLVKGYATDSAKLDMLPAFRHLVYKADSIDVEATTWMTLCKGVY